MNDTLRWKCMYCGDELYSDVYHGCKASLDYKKQLELAIKLGSCYKQGIKQYANLKKIKRKVEDAVNNLGASPYIEDSISQIIEPLELINEYIQCEENSK